MPFSPLALIAEVTHRCPLHCVYCSNPTELAAVSSELSTEEWISVFRQAGKLGMLHAHFTGGEPLARTDLTELIAAARAAGLYTNLITSGIGLNEQRLQILVDAGLDHIQVSFQDSREEAANWIGGARAHAHKIELSHAIRRHKIAFTVNLVVHRQNLDHLEEMIAFIEQLQPERVEIAHTQYYGWALKNRAALMPTLEQIEETSRIVEEAEVRLKGILAIDYVVPDYYALRPKKCMGGWGRQFFNISPAGKILPCHAAETITGLEFESVRSNHSIAWIWQNSEAFNRYRGTGWMPEPCRSCDRRAMDFGGCRCQAFQLTGDAAATDPACSLAPSHGLIEAARAEALAPTGSFTYRAARAAEEAMKKSGGKLDGEGVKNAIESLKAFDTISGKLVFQPNHAAIMDIEVGVLKGGKVEVEKVLKANP